MNIWKTATGVILLVAGILAAVQVYGIVVACSTAISQVPSILEAIVGAYGVQSCYDAQLTELGGVIVALIGIVVIFYGDYPMKTQKAKAKR